MTASAAAALLNLLGYITGLSLYTMLLVMLLKGPRAASAVGAASDKADRLPLGAALLGLAWNLGALLDLGIHNFGGGGASAPIVGVPGAVDSGTTRVLAALT